MSSFRQSAKGLSLFTILRDSSLNVATMAMKTGLLWVRSVRVGGLGQAGIGLQGFVKDLHWPPFFGGCGDGAVVASQVTENQMKYSFAIVFVFKEWAYHKDFFRLSLEPAAHRSLCWKIQFIYSNKTLLLSIFFAQCDQPVALKRRNEMPALARDEIEVFLCGEPVVG